MSARQGGTVSTKPAVGATGKKSSKVQSGRKVFVVFNPKAGNAGQEDELRALLARHFPSPEWKTEIYETTGKEDLPAVCRAAGDKGASLVVSAGGDGTVVGVANGLVNGKVPLGILPLGTGNDLARALLIPLKLDEAMALLGGDHTVAKVDALKVGDRYYFSNVSVGVSPRMMKDTDSAEKKRFGALAYIWTMLTRASIFQVHRYDLTIDGKQRRLRAVEILTSSTTLLKKPPFVFGPPETLSDGQCEIYVITARTPIDYVKMLWARITRSDRPAKLYHWVGRKSIRIEYHGTPQLVQADGEVTGHTPVDIEIVPRALPVIVPTPAPTSATKRAQTPRVKSKAGVPG
jgi:diacylglycerol kinase (ATP)